VSAGIRDSRQPSIDVLRALAIVMMVFVHFVENLSGSFGVAGGPFGGAHRFWWLPTGFAAPLFTFLSGVSHHLWIRGQIRRGTPDERITKTTVRRGLFLVALGFAFNVLIWMPEDTFNWDILTFIGCALVVLDGVRRVQPAVPLVACGTVVALAPALRALADYPAFWADGSFAYDFTLSDVVLGFLVTGYFPLVPWIVFPVAGFLLAPLIFPAAAAAASPDSRPASRLPGAVATALIACAGAALLTAQPVSTLLGTAAPRWTMFPASTAYTLGTLGGAILATTVLHRLIDGTAAAAAAVRGSRTMEWATALSRHSLSIYLLHHAVHIWPLWTWGALAADDPTAFWQIAMPAAAAVACAAAFMVAAVAVARWMERPGAFSAEAALRWLCDA